MKIRQKTSAYIALIPIPGTTLFLLFFLFGGSGCTHLDQQHGKACESLTRLAINLDSIFADPLAEEEYRKTRIKLSGGMKGNTEKRMEYSGRTKVRIALPGLEERWGVILGGDTGKGATSFGDSLGDLAYEDNDELLLTSEDERTYESFLRFFRNKESGIKIDLDIGVKYTNQFRYFFRLRGTHEGWIDCIKYRYTHRVFWLNTEGFGTRGRIEFDFGVDEDVFVRQSVEMWFSEVTEGLDIYYNIYLRDKTRRNLAVSYELKNYGSTDPWLFHYSQFTGRFRRSIFYKWLEIEMAPNIRFKERNGKWVFRPGFEFYISLIFDATHRGRI